MSDYLAYMLREIALSGDPDDAHQHAVMAHVRRLVREAGAGGRAPCPKPRIRVPARRQSL